MKHSKRLEKKTKALRIYSNSDFKKASRLEKLHMYMLEPERHHLADKHFNYLEELKQVFHILSSEMSMPAAIAKIKEMLKDPGSQARIYRMINDTKELFGATIKRNKDFDRMVIKERYLEIIKKANDQFDITKDSKFLETIRLTYQAIDRLEGLSDHTPGEIDPAVFEFPDLIVSTDPKYLNAGYEDGDEDGDEDEDEDEDFDDDHLIIDEQE